MQTLDGRWLALDARMLYRRNVAGSEFYNTPLEAELTDRLGVTFTERADRTDGKRPVREIAGVDPRLTTGGRRGAGHIDARQRAAVGRFQADHGRVPTTVETIALAQQANLSTREPKHEPRSLDEQRAAWRDEAITELGSAQAVDMMLTEPSTGTVPPVNRIAAGSRRQQRRSSRRSRPVARPGRCGMCAPKRCAGSANTPCR